MADYEGYLLLHEGGRYADPLYFELEGGVLSYYTKKGGKWLGQYSLTRHRAVARAMPGVALSPHRFSLELCPVRSVHDTERSLKGFKRMAVVLSGSSQHVMLRWIHAIQTWRRRNWRDSVVIQDCDDEAKALRMLMCMHKLELRITKTDVADAAPPLRKLEVAPEQDDRESFSVDKRNLMLASSLSHFNRLSFHNRTSTTTVAL